MLVQEKKREDDNDWIEGRTRCEVGKDLEEAYLPVRPGKVDCERKLAKRASESSSRCPLCRQDSKDSIEYYTRLIQLDGTNFDVIDF